MRLFAGMAGTAERFRMSASKKLKFFWPPRCASVTTGKVDCERALALVLILLVLVALRGLVRELN